MSTPSANPRGLHLIELRRRTLIAFLAILLFSAIAYVFSEQLVRLFMTPLFSARPEMVRLVYTKLTEAFVTYLKLALLVGIICSFPVLLYQSWMFVAPGLHQHEKKLAIRVVFWATLLFASGAGFAFFIVLPQILTFFLDFAGPRLEALPKLGSYLTFVARTALAFGLAFEIPFLMVVAVKTGLAARRDFQDKRKYYYPAIILLAFLLTTGDLTGAVLLAFPLFGLYEAGIIVIRIFTREKQEKESSKLEGES